jgi:flagellar assembly protein FliH
MEAEHAALLRQCVASTERGLAALDAAVKALDAVTVPVVTQAQDVLAHSSLDLAEAVIGHELTQGEMSARAALARVMAHPILPGVHTVRMNPTDLAVLAEADIASTGLNIVPDESLAPGDATADFEDGHLDARIHTALNRAKVALLGENA